MKEIILFFTILLSVSKINAQSISMEAISFGGDSYTNSTSHLSFTSGQVMSSNYSNGSNILSEGFQHQYYTYWVGATDNAWNNMQNWNGGPVPGLHTDIILLSGKPFYPVITLNASCRSLIARPGTMVMVNPGFNLIITGN